MNVPGDVCSSLIGGSAFTLLSSPSFRALPLPNKLFMVSLGVVENSALVRYGEREGERVMGWESETVRV